MAGNDAEEGWVEPPSSRYSIADPPGHGNGGALALNGGGRVEAPTQCLQQLWVLTSQGHGGENIVMALVNAVDPQSK